VNARSVPANKHPLTLVAAKHPSPDPGFQDLFARGMDQALGIEKASLDTVVCLSSCAIDIYKNAFCLAPAVRELFDATGKAFAACLEMQMSWMTIMAPRVAGHSASSSGSQYQASAEMLEQSMDVAIGAVPAEEMEPVTELVFEGRAASRAA
jgi:hypothetical protein